MSLIVGLALLFIGHKPIKIKKGEAIAHMMMRPVYDLDMEVKWENK